METSLPPKLSTWAVKKNERRAFPKFGKLLRLKRYVRCNFIYLVASVFVWGLPLYMCGTNVKSIGGPLRDTCFFDGKLYTSGIIIEAAPGIRCKCYFSGDAAARRIEETLS